MAEVVRYDVSCETSDFHYGATLKRENCKDGEHVAYSDYAELKALNDALMILVEPIIDAWVEYRPEAPVLPTRNLDALAYMLGKL